MNWDALGASGEILGALVVVVSVLYLGAQIKESSRVARAESQRQLLDTTALYVPFWSSPDIVRVVRDGIHHFEDLDPDDQVRFHMTLMPLVTHVESAFRMYRQELLEKESYDGWMAGFAAVIRESGGAVWWASSGQGIPTDFREALDDFIETNDPPRLSEVQPFWAAKGDRRP